MTSLNVSESPHPEIHLSGFGLRGLVFRAKEGILRDRPPTASIDKSAPPELSITPFFIVLLGNFVVYTAAAVSDDNC